MLIASMGICCATAKYKTPQVYPLCQRVQKTPRLVKSVVLMCWRASLLLATEVRRRTARVDPTSAGLNGCPRLPHEAGAAATRSTAPYAEWRGSCAQTGESPVGFSQHYVSCFGGQSKTQHILDGNIPQIQSRHASHSWTGTAYVSQPAHVPMSPALRSER